MDYNTQMNYEEYAGKSVLLLGKTRSLNGGEFETLLKLHDMSVARSFDDTVALIIEGKLMNPLEREESARLYELRAAPIVDITAIEQWLCGSIEPNRLLMSLKLSRDHVRLVDFIQNPHITDELFFKLLKLYDWQGEGLFDNDTNRDVTAAIIGRFYEDLERNHNVQYAMSGLAHLIEKYGNTQLINVIAESWSHSAGDERITRSLTVRCIGCDGTAPRYSRDTFVRFAKRACKARSVSGAIGP